MDFELLTKLNKSYKRNNYSKSDLEHMFEEDKLTLLDKLAKRLLIWDKEYVNVLDNSNSPFFNWFNGGKIDPIKNILEKHLDKYIKNKAAVIWRGSDYSERIFTYQSLYFEVLKFASALTRLGIKNRDLVMIYMPNLPELVVAMLACLKIGAIHSLYHPSYSAESLADRISDCKPKLLITSDYSLMGKEVNLKSKVDDALNKSSHQPSYCIVVDRGGKKVRMKPLRDLWYHDLISDEMYSSALQLQNVSYDSNDTLFLMYTSTNMKEPKGLKFSCAGYLLWTMFTYLLLFDPDSTDTIWNTADISWMSGHTYGVYGPLLCGQSIVIFEDSIDFETANRFYGICERYRVTKCYTTPKILKSLMNAQMKKKVYHKLNELKFLFLGGEQPDNEVLDWTFKKILSGRSPMLNIYSLTETGGAVAAQIPGYSDIKPGSVSKPLPGVSVSIVDKMNGAEIKDPNITGAVMLENSIPSICASICKGEDIYKSMYWRQVGGKLMFRTGDGAEYDNDKCILLTGRLDDVMHVGGKRISLLEIESAIKKHSLVKDVAVISINNDKRGDLTIAFCVLKKSVDESYNSKIAREINEHIISEIGEAALPDDIKFSRVLPKSPDGQILRDLLKDIAMQM